MKRLGMFSGKIYDDDYDFSNCPECCVNISDEDAKNEQFVKQRHLRDIMACVKCWGCPAAQH